MMVKMVDPVIKREEYLADVIDENGEYIIKNSPFIRTVKMIKWYLLFDIPCKIKYKRFCDNRAKIIFG
jgi:hypothetical protein